MTQEIWTREHVEIPGDLRQGDIDDAGVQGGHKGPQTDGQQDDAPVQGLSFRSRGRGRHGVLSYAKPRRSGRGFFGNRPPGAAGNSFWGS